LFPNDVYDHGLAWDKVNYLVFEVISPVDIQDPLRTPVLEDKNQTGSVLLFLILFPALATVEKCKKYNTIK